MGEVKSFIMGNSIKYKLLMNTTSVLLTTILIINIFVTQIFSWNMKKELNNNSYQIISQVRNNVDFYIKDIENIINYLSQNEDFIGFMKNQKNNYEIENIKQDINKYMEPHAEIVSVAAVRSDGKFISNNLQKISRDNLNIEKWYLDALDKENITLMPKPINRNLVLEEGRDVDDIVTISKRISYEGNAYGVVIFDIDMNFLEKVIDNAGIGSKGFVCIMDPQGRIIYSPKNEIVYRINPKWLSKKKRGDFFKLISGDKYQIQFSLSDYTQWRTIGVFSLGEKLKVISEIQWVTFIITLVILALAVIISTKITDTITKPIEKLRKLMKRAENGELDVRFNHKYDDEIGQLGRSFNKMINSTKELLNLVYIEQKKKKEAELRIFQEQIKPHFLYNTLDTIHWLAVEKETDEITRLIRALTNLFRIGLNRGRELIPLKNELEHVKSYLVIQMARYEDKFDFSFNVDSGVHDYEVIKIILQPLVENAIYHGIKMKKGKGLIKIKCEESEECLILSVEDNGAGIDQAKLQELRESLNHSSDQSGDGVYGLLNVNERIRLSFGSEYGIEIHSVKNQGTKVVVRHPKNRKN